ncbi:MAG: maleylpyruvate isomerase N-terminal domain-containing protein, partial [Phycicoccus sp.]
MDPHSPDVLSAHTARLLVSARGLDDPGTMSLCAGWTRGHVLTHVARNADGLAALVRAAVDGTGETMYAGDAERDAEIEA